MYKSNRNTMIITIMVVVLVTVAVVAALGLTACSKRGANEDSSSLSGIIESSDDEVISLPEESEEESSEESSSSSSSTIVTPPPASSQPVWTPPASSSSKPSKPSSSSSSSSSSSVSGKNESYTKSGRYTTRQTLGNVSIKTGDVELKNKTINGNLTLTKAVDDTVYLEKVTVKGQLILQGGDEVFLTDCTIGEVVVKNYESGDNTLYAVDKTRVGAVFVYSDITLDENELDSDYTGFRSLLTREGEEDSVSVFLESAEMTTITLDELAYLEIDGDSEVSTVKVNSKSTIKGDGHIKNLWVGSKDVTCYVSYETKKFSSSRYVDTFIDVKLAAPANVRFEVSGNDIVVKWDSVTNATSYPVSIKIGTGATKSYTPTTTEQKVDSISNLMGKTVTAEVKAKRDGATSSTVKVTLNVTKLATPTVLITPTTTSLTFSWTQDPNTADYTVTVGDVKDTKNTAGKVEFTSLSNSVSKTIKVKANGGKLNKNGAAYTYYSDSDEREVTGTTLTSEVTPPTGLVISDITSTSVKAAWTGTTGTSYTVTVSAGGSTIGTAQSIEESTENGTTGKFTATVIFNSGITAGSYTVTVTANTANPAGRASTATASTTFTVAKLATPNVTAAYGNGKVKYSWDVVNGAGGYRLSGAATGTKGISDLSVTVDATAAGSNQLSVVATGYYNGTDKVYYLDSAAGSATYDVDPAPALPAAITYAGTTATDYEFTWPSVTGVDYTATNAGKISAANGTVKLSLPKTNTSFKLTVQKANSLSQSKDYTIQDKSGIVIAADTTKTSIALNGDTFTVSNLTRDPGYKYSVQLVNTTTPATAYTAYDLSVTQATTATTFTVANLMGANKTAADLPASYTVTITATDANNADTTLYLTKTVTGTWTAPVTPPEQT